MNSVWCGVFRAKDGFMSGRVITETFGRERSQNVNGSVETECKSRYLVTLPTLVNSKALSLSPKLLALG